VGVYNGAWRSELDAIYKAVAELRETYALAKKHGQITERNGYLQFHDHWTERLMDQKRRACVDRAQALRQDAGLLAF